MTSESKRAERPSQGPLGGSSPDADADRAAAAEGVEKAAPTDAEEHTESAAQAAAPADTVVGAGQLAAELEDARASVDELKERFLRAKAEAENVRRRAENDVASARKFAIERFAAEMLAVKDSLDLARSVELGENDSPAVAQMLEGLELTLKQMGSVFDRFAIREVAPEKGEKFDPELHQAMTTQPSEDVEPNHVLSVMQKGYTLNDRLLRPAMVIVAARPAAQDEASS
ncbi:MAG: nucleotide exchange factor GrpE [Gammaproteobacteria bacterium]|nr:nucleotide exchange factor GrpE [Gammaproteobacteria bacterium]